VIIINIHKKVSHFLILIFILTIFLSGCGIYNLFSFTLPDDAEFLALIQELDTPRKIGQYMLDNFTYEPHILWTPTPYTLWQIKKGDCNDFATFGVFIADYHGYETYQIEIFFDGTFLKHCIAVYVENVCYSITNGRYYYFGFYNFREIVDFDSESRNIDWLKYKVYDYENNLIEKVQR